MTMRRIGEMNGGAVGGPVSGGASFEAMTTRVRYGQMAGPGMGGMGGMGLGTGTGAAGAGNGIGGIIQALQQIVQLIGQLAQRMTGGQAGMGTTGTTGAMGTGAMGTGTTGAYAGTGTGATGGAAQTAENAGATGPCGQPAAQCSCGGGAAQAGGGAMAGTGAMGGMNHAAMSMNEVEGNVVGRPNAGTGHNGMKHLAHAFPQFLVPGQSMYGGVSYSQNGITVQSGITAMNFLGEIAKNSVLSKNPGLINNPQKLQNEIATKLTGYNNYDNFKNEPGARQIMAKYGITEQMIKGQNHLYHSMMTAPPIDLSQYQRADGSLPPGFTIQGLSFHTFDKNNVKVTEVGGGMFAMEPVSNNGKDNSHTGHSFGAMYFRASSAQQANAFARNVMNNVIKAKTGAGDNMLDPAMARFLGVGGVPAYQNSPTTAGGMTGMGGMGGHMGHLSTGGLTQNANFGNQANTSTTVVNNYYLGNRYNGVGASNSVGSQMQQTEMAYVARLLTSISQLLRYFSFAR